MAAAVNLQTIPSNVHFDFLPPSHPHSRSNSLSSSSTHSPHSRPHSSQDVLPRMPGGIHHDDPYRLSPYIHGDQVRHSSIYSLSSTDLSPGQSPPNGNMTNPALKGHMRQSHLRARAAASPYPRDTESVHSSSSETDDITMFLSNTPDYSTMYGPGQPIQTNLQEPRQPTGVFGRMSINPDHALQKLAANVRVATTTSASDRAKQIFVQAWCVFTLPFPCHIFSHPPRSGSPPTMLLTLMGMYHARAFTFHTAESATSTRSLILIRPPSAKPSDSVFPRSKQDVWEFGGIANIIVRVLHSSSEIFIDRLFLEDCGIRPATSAEAEFLQDYIRKSNNNAGQSSINAARAAQESGDSANKGEDRSDEDEDDDSEGSSASKRNSLILPGDLKGTVTFEDISDKTPTAGSLLSQAQVLARSNSYPSHTPIRRHASQLDPSIAPQPTLTLGPNADSQYAQPQHHLSVRHMPHFPSIEEAIGASSASAQCIAGREVWGWFQDHLDAVLDSARAFRFDQFEMHLRGFWSTLTGTHREVVHAPAIAGLMAKADAIVYDVSLQHMPLLCGCSIMHRKYSSFSGPRCSPLSRQLL